MIRVFVPGKIHLIGEHFVLYGLPAILAPINLGIEAKISQSEEKQILGIVQYDSAIKDLQSTIEKEIKKKFKVKNVPEYKIELEIKIPVGSGLGSSATLSAIFTIGLLKFLKIQHSTEEVFEIAIHGEKIFHGNPSGGDLSAVLQNKLIWFKKEDESRTITPLDFAPKIRKFLLINSGKPVEGTGEMISLVKSKVQGKIGKVFENQEKLTPQITEVLKNGDQDLFIEIIKKTEKNLEEIGVVGKVAQKIIREIEGLNGAAKITGAGGIKKGSGMILAYHKDLNKLVTFAKNNDLSYYPITI